MNKIIIVIVVLIVAIGIGIFYELGPFLHPSPSLETTAFSSALSGSWVETYNQTYTSSIINSSNVPYYPGQQSLLKQQFNLVGSAQSPISVDISVSNFNSTSYAASVLSELTSAISNSSSFSVSNHSSGTYSGVPYLYLNATQNISGSTVVAGFSPFTFSDVKCGPLGEGLQMRIINTAGFSVKLTSERIISFNGLAGSAAGNLTGTLGPMASVLLGFNPSITYCPSTGNSVYSAQIAINYTYKTSFGLESFTAVGTISGHSHPGPAIPITALVLIDNSHLITIIFNGTSISLAKAEALFSSIEASLIKQASSISSTSTSTTSNSSTPATTRTGFAPFMVSVQTCNNTGMYIALTNEGGETVTLENSQIISSQGVNENYSTIFTPRILSVGLTSLMVLKGASCAGLTYSATLKITYSEGAFNFSSIGVIRK